MTISREIKRNRPTLGLYGDIGKLVDRAKVIDDIGEIMPRSVRLGAPGVLHHVIIRGIEGRNIFREISDRNDFLKRLSAADGGKDSQRKRLPIARMSC
jgi:hypothetical protein